MAKTRAWHPHTPSCPGSTHLHPSPCCPPSRVLVMLDNFTQAMKSILVLH